MTKKCREPSLFCREIAVCGKKKKRDVLCGHHAIVCDRYSSMITAAQNLPSPAEKRQEPLYFSAVEMML